MQREFREFIQLECMSSTPHLVNFVNTIDEISNQPHSFESTLPQVMSQLSEHSDTDSESQLPIYPLLGPQAIVDHFFLTHSPAYHGFSGTIPPPHPISYAPSDFSLASPISMDFLKQHCPKWIENIYRARETFRIRYPLLNVMEDGDYTTDARQDVYQAALFFRSRPLSGPFAQPGLRKSIHLLFFFDSLSLQGQ